MSDSTLRFTDRVENYIKYRSGYPEQILNLLEKRINLKNSMVLADVGSGTGKLSKLFLKYRNKVFCIEPNEAMRLGAEKSLSHYTNFQSISGTAEETKLNDNSVDLIIAGQAFHWFNITGAKKEFSRILKPDGYVVLIWNSRNKTGSSFNKEYEQLIKKYSSEYERVAHYRIVDSDFKTFFSNGEHSSFQLENNQKFDIEGLKGRLFSSSYMPNESSEEYNGIVNDLNKIFEVYNKNGLILFEYVTEIYYGKI
ncbi:MAG: Ubiquinone/menaquinone biosynthesis C-methyltransferase UbiE [Candidatus Heimdallarchaeota archaeon LC_3]|nr:MAG: Ubiquinone/menaquinone biosynthesis C-methyltransferase UbiE [Candidatus Heimdallarchaeota archaeon LC_3]